MQLLVLPRVRLWRGDARATSSNDISEVPQNPPEKYEKSMENPENPEPDCFCHPSTPGDIRWGNWANSWQICQMCLIPTLIDQKDFQAKTSPATQPMSASLGYLWLKSSTTWEVPDRYQACMTDHIAPSNAYDTHHVQEFGHRNGCEDDVARGRPVVSSAVTPLVPLWIWMAIEFQSHPITSNNYNYHVDGKLLVHS